MNTLQKRTINALLSNFRKTGEPWKFKTTTLVKRFEEYHANGGDFYGLSGIGWVAIKDIENYTGKHFYTVKRCATCGARLK